MYDKILCLSGGIDSWVAYHYLQKPQTIFFDTGTYSDVEKEKVLKLAPNTIIDTSLNFSEIQTDEKAFIPARNLLFATRAAQYAREVVIAGVKDDVVSDKNENAFDSMSSTLQLLLDSPDVCVTSPFWNRTKAQVVKWYMDYYGDPSPLIVDTFSCYAPVDGEECRACPACFRKWNALWENKVEIEFRNIPLMKKYVKSASDNFYTKERNKSILTCCSEYFAAEVDIAIPQKKMTFCFDIDGVLTNETEGHNYGQRTPNYPVIKKLKELYHNGNKIILQSARYHEDLAVTQSWLDAYGIPYHELHLGKPKADFYIDDLMLKVEEI